MICPTRRYAKKEKTYRSLLVCHTHRPQFDQEAYVLVCPRSFRGRPYDAVATVKYLARLPFILVIMIVKVIVALVGSNGDINVHGAMAWSSGCPDGGQRWAVVGGFGWVRRGASLSLFLFLDFEVVLLRRDPVVESLYFGAFYQGRTELLAEESLHAHIHPAWVDDIAEWVVRGGS